MRRAARPGRGPRRRAGGAGRAPAGTGRRGGTWGGSPPISPVLGNPSNLAQVGGAWEGGPRSRGEPRERGARGRDSLRVTRARRPTRVSQQLFSPVGHPGNFPLPGPGARPWALRLLGLGSERGASGGDGLSGEAPGTPSPPPQRTSNPGFPSESPAPQLWGRGDVLRGLPGVLGPLGCRGAGGGVGGGARLA